MSLDNDDKKWIKGGLDDVRQELGERIDETNRRLDELRTEVRGGFEGMKTACAEIIGAQTRALVETMIAPRGNGKPPKEGGEENE